MKTKMRLFSAMALILIGVMIIPSIMAAETSYCCEKTLTGAWCQNAPQEQCNSSFAVSPTSCESTGYCREGCCFNRNTGTCSKNSPERICTDDGGIWTSEKNCAIPQCELGCCLIGDQAAFVSQTRCGHLASVYGLVVDYRSDISSEVACIASATADVEGACVWTEGFDNKCERTTKGKCSELSSSRNSTFYENLLCSNPVLNTTCQQSEKTTCVEGKDGVYFLDTCGNLANIYDATKAKDEISNYWREIIDPLFSCTLNLGSNQDSCGNCNYYDGSTCKKFDRGIDDMAPSYGENVCRDLGCDYDTDGLNGINAIYEHYQHGETWCAQSPGASIIMFNEENSPNSLSENTPGTRYFRLVCYNGEVTIEPCADFRQEVCMQQDVSVSDPTIGKGTFSNANCIVNKWQDCIAQDDEDDCENSDLRDCSWITVDGDDKCVPKYAPGLNFWGENADAETQCTTGNAKCEVEYTRSKEWEGGKALFKKATWTESADWRITDNERCDPSGTTQKFQNWRDDLNDYCASLGDCGFSNNYIGKKGYLDWDDVVDWTSKMDEEELAEYEED